MDWKKYTKTQTGYEQTEDNILEEKCAAVLKYACKTINFLNGNLNDTLKKTLKIPNIMKKVFSKECCLKKPIKWTGRNHKLTQKHINYKSSYSQNISKEKLFIFKLKLFAKFAKSNFLQFP